MKITKRNRRSRIRGRRGCGFGRRQKHRGKGSRGGVGMAGTGKRAAQKRTFILKYFPDYFGKRGFKSINQKSNKKFDVINLEGINKKMDEFLKKGIAKKTNDAFEIKLSKYKILGAGELKIKVIITAGAASKNAIEKVRAAGGDIKTA
ncbi:50S ribosomal protein L15 [Candidatus Pacearchaeota archaeon CG06_land_8_20_14_3_00_35_12]|nr:MAG: 50S ribosomal protein L15 [Candidatus Pacearchaeota archaeon CG06_land_8_20_14_3_00_35_12]